MRLEKKLVFKRIYQLFPKKKMEYLKYYLDFLFAMTEKEIKARYKRVVFGFLWVVLNPLLQMIIIGSIFSFFIRIPDYFLFLFLGLLVWQFFSLSLSKATPSIVYERALLQKSRFPVEAIPISIILSNFFHMLVSFILLLLILVPMGKIVFPQALVVVLVFLWILVFTIGISLLFSSLNVRFRDISFFVQTLLVLWFYATPILFSLELIPGYLYPIFYLNPLTSEFEILHYTLLKQGVVNQQLIIINLIITFVILFLGIVVFKKEHKFFVDWL